MATAPFEVIVGPGQVYVAAYGTAFPHINDAPGAGWTDLGKTDGGVKAAMEQTNVEHRADQSLYPLKITRREAGLKVSFSLAEVTLERLSKVLNDATVTDVPAAGGEPGYRHFPLSSTGDMPHLAMLVRGPSCYYNGNGQFELEKVAMTGKPEYVLNPEGKVVIATEWTACEGATPNQVGRLVHQDAAVAP
jgi:hypothetical protein